MSVELTESAPQAETSPITVDQAAALLYERKQKAVAEASKPRAPDGKFAKAQPEETAQPEGEAETVTEESEAPTQEAEGVEGEATDPNPTDETAESLEPETAIEPPQFWDAEGKERFAKLSPASQKEVLEYEKQRTAAVAKAMQKSADTQKAAEAKLVQLRGIVERFGEQEEPVSAQMKAWDEWFAKEGVELARTNPGAFVAEQARYQQEKREFEKLTADKAEAEKALYSEHVREQNRVLAEVAPELADPKEGKQRFADTLAHLRSQGYDNDQLRWISARDMSIGYKAMLWDRAQARSKEAPKPKPKQAGPTAAPAGQGQRSSSSDQRIKSLEAKRSLSIEEAIELRRLRRPK